MFLKNALIALICITSALTIGLGVPYILGAFVAWDLGWIMKMGEWKVGDRLFFLLLGGLLSFFTTFGGLLVGVGITDLLFKEEK